jgi:hypothetical protein
VRSSRNRRKDRIRYLKKVHTLKIDKLIKPAKKVLNLKVARKQVSIKNKKQMPAKKKKRMTIKNKSKVQYLKLMIVIHMIL